MAKATDTNTPKDTQNKSTFSSTLSWLPKKTFELEITIPHNLVAKTYEEVLNQATAKATIKGFRTGKVPKEMVEQSIGKEKLYEEVVEKLVSQAYFEAVEQNNLHPITDPAITPVSLKEDSDWVVKASACEVPDVKLNNYKDAIKGLRAKKSIWTPDKGTTPAQDKEQTDAKPSTEEIYDELLKVAEVELPDMLVESETNRMLGNMVDQVMAAGLNIQQYLESKHKTQDQLRQEYQELATKSLKLEFIITKIAQEEKISVDPKEVESIVGNSNDPYAKKALENPQQKLYLSILLRKQKTIDYLKSL